MDARGERILSDVNLAFKRDPSIDEYDYLPVDQATQNRSPVTLVSHKLGIEFWSVKVLFQHAYTKLLAWRNREANSKYLEPHEILSLTRAVVMINPECSTAWNVRKELILTGDLKAGDCLKLGTLILTKHPKSAEVFSHRKWLLNHLVSQCPVLQALMRDRRENRDINSQNCFRSTDQPWSPNNSNGHNNHMYHIHLPTAEVNSPVYNILVAEFDTCTLAASKYSCNYYAWNHRTWVMKLILCYSYTMFLSELSWSKSWIQQHISDHSCFQYRQFLLMQLSSCQQYQCSLSDHCDNTDGSRPVNNTHNNGCSQLPVENPFISEMSLISFLIHSYPGHETLWYHRRFVLHSLACAIKQKKQMNCQQDFVNQPDCKHLYNTKWEMSVKELNAEETQFAEQELKSPDLFQRHLAKRYLNWLENFFET
ncbi:protein prenyltransferase alpha subunit repeat-containing protein 1 [Octopus bimaculoides]|nr:protein prenyltransferase alpha subunit repeat-containing protein 1 [Octopus bimaculoides]|eukprot:XP_014775248.1 PREDICTED: protein prenyltransferase alpha subunit repeat-containing protein 1-like isoform X2 [Octopus bimaculoides]